MNHALVLIIGMCALASQSCDPADESLDLEVTFHDDCADGVYWGTSQTLAYQTTIPNWAIEGVTVQQGPFEEETTSFLMSDYFCGEAKSMIVLVSDAT